MSSRRHLSMRTVLLFLMLAPGLASASGGGDFPNPKAKIEPASQGSSSWRFGFGLGYKRLEPAWAPADRQVDFAVVDAAYRPSSWPLALTIGIGLGLSAAVPRYAGVAADFCGTYEVSAGVRGEWPEWRRTRAFAGAALAVMGADATNSHALTGIGPRGTAPAYDQEHGTGLGARIELGVTRPIRRSLRIGVRGAWSRGQVSLFGRHLDPGGVQVEALVFGGR